MVTVVALTVTGAAVTAVAVTAVAATAVLQLRLEGEINERDLKANG